MNSVSIPIKSQILSSSYNKLLKTNSNLFQSIRKSVIIGVSKYNKWSSLDITIALFAFYKSAKINKPSYGFWFDLKTASPKWVNLCKSFTFSKI